MRHDECQACMGNVMDGMTCHACGLKGPKGDGWVFMVQDLKARVAELEALAAGFAPTLEYAQARAKKAEDEVSTLRAQQADRDRLLADWDAARIAKDRATTEATVLRAQMDTLRAQLAEAMRFRSYVRDSVDETWEALPAEVTEVVISAVVEALGGSAYDCVRVWSAWSYGTMGPDDFVGIADDSDRVAEIAKEVTVPLLMALLDADRQPCPIGWPARVTP